MTKIVHHFTPYKSEVFRNTHTNTMTTNIPYNFKKFLDKYVIELALPGLSKEDLELSINEGHLSIKVKDSDNVNSQNLAAKLKSMYKPMNIELPKDADAEKIEARMIQGLLEITLQLIPKATSKYISVA